MAIKANGRGDLNQPAYYLILFTAAMVLIGLRNLQTTKVVRAFRADQACRRALPEKLRFGHGPSLPRETFLSRHDQRERVRIGVRGEEPAGDIHGEQTGGAGMVADRERRGLFEPELKAQLAQRVLWVGHDQRKRARVHDVPHPVLSAAQPVQVGDRATQQFEQAAVGIPADLTRLLIPPEHLDPHRRHPEMLSQALDRDAAGEPAVTDQAVEEALANDGQTIVLRAQVARLRVQSPAGSHERTGATAESVQWVGLPQ